MNAIVQFNPSSVPSFVRKGELSETAKALAGSAPGGKRISIKGGVFRLLDGGKEIAAIDERYLDVVLVRAAAKVSRVFYAGKWDPESPSAPTCWSADGDKPSPDAEVQQADSCASCPMNVAGSGEGQSRACRYQQRVAVVLATEIEEGSVMQLIVPAASLFGKAVGNDNRPLQDYARWLAAQGVNPETVVTRLKFDTSAESPKLFFKAMRWLTDDEYEVIERAAQSQEAIDAVTMSIAKPAPAAPAAPAALPGAAPKAKAKAKPAPAADDEPPAPPPKAKAKPAPAAEEDGDEEEPTVRKAAPTKPAAAIKPDLAKAIEDWDD